MLNLSWKDSTAAGQTGYEIWRKRGFYGGYTLALVAAPGIYNINDEDIGLSQVATLNGKPAGMSAVSGKPPRSV